MRHSDEHNRDKFECIISELTKRGMSVLLHRPTRWGYVVDAVIPNSKIVILKMPDQSKQSRVAMSQFKDLVDRLQSDGYQVLIIPKNAMNEAEVRGFCDRIAPGPGLATA